MSDDKAVAWQRRQQYSDIPGFVPQWQFVSKEEATGHFDRLPGYEYRPLYTHPAEQAVTEVSLLAEMSKHLNWELDWGSLDPSDETSECAWRVHARRGNRNDREWMLIGYGDTPIAALKAAMEAGR